MNKIYKVIWSKTRNCYVAVAEFVKRNGKGGSVLNRRHIAAALAAVAICAAPAGALANTGGHWDVSAYIGDAPDYKVVIDSNVDGWVYGRLESDKTATGASVTVESGTVSGYVFGGRSYFFGNAEKNTVTISGGEVKGIVYGGRSEYGSATNNTVILSRQGSEAPPVINGTLFGGLSDDGGTVSGNTLQVEAVGLSAPEIRNFENYKFVLPKDIKAGDTMLTLKNQGSKLEIDGSKVDASMGSRTLTDVGLQLDESVTLLHKTGGSGTFIVNNVDKLPQFTERLDNEATGFVTLAGKVEKPDGRDELNLTVTEKYLYGDGGTNTPGQRQTGNTLTITGGKANAAFGGRASSGDVTGNIVTMEGGELIELTNGSNPNYGIAGSLYGGASEGEISPTGSASGSAIENTVTVTGGTVQRNVYGGWAPASAAGNRVILSKVDGKEAPVVEWNLCGGGSTVGIAENNEVTIRGGKVQGTVYGGYSNSGKAENNTVTVSGGEVNGWVYGGYILRSGDATGNTVTVEDGTVDVYGGRSEDGSAANNAVTIAGGTVGIVYGGYIYRSGDATNNTVTIAGGTVGIVYGGYSNSGKAENNTVTVSGGTVNDEVYGGHSYFGNAANNTVTISGGKLNSNVYGGRSSDLQGGASVTGNTVILSRQGSEAPPDINGTLFGGLSDGGGAVSGNTLQVEAVGLSAPEIRNFENYKFVLPSDVKKGDTMLTLKNQGSKLEIDGTKVDLAVAKDGGLNIDFGESVTLLHKTLGPGAFSVKNLTGAVQTSKLDGESTGFDVMKYTLDKPDHEDKLNVTVSELHLYGDGGTNTPGQRETGNTLTINSGKANVAFGGRASTGAVTKNNVKMTGGEIVKGNDVWIQGALADINVSGNLFGGFADAGNVEKNTVEIIGGTVQGDVFGGYSLTKGNVKENLVTIRGGKISGRVYGGVAYDGEVAGNTVILSKVAGEEAPVLEKAIYGGIGTHPSGNTLQVEAVGLSAPQISTFHNYRFVLPSDVSNGDTLLQLTAQNTDLAIESDNVSISTAGILTGLKMNDSVTLLHKTTGNGALTLSGKGYVYEKLDGEADGLPIKEFRLKKPEAEERVDAEYTARYLYGDGGTNTPGQRQTGNTLRIADGEKATVAFGGRATSGNVTGNKVTMTGGELVVSETVLFAGGLFGGLSDSGEAGNNNVAMEGGKVKNIYGGYTTDKDVAENTVEVSGGTIEKYVYGGHSDSGNASQNLVTIRGGTIGDKVHGGFSGKGTATKNTVNISGGTIGGSVYGGRSDSGNLSQNTVTISGGTVNDWVYGGRTSGGNVSQNTVTIRGGTVTGTVYGGFSATGAVSGNAVNLTDTTNGLDGAKLYGYNDVAASHTGNELHIGGAKTYDKNGTATITKGSWQGMDANGKHTNRVDTVSNFDSIALHNVVWGDVPAISAKEIKNIGGLDVTGLEFFTHPDNSMVHEHALKDYMVLVHGDNNDLTGLKISYLDEGNVKTEALTNQGIHYRNTVHHSTENGVTVDGKEVKRIFLADHNKSVDFFYHITGDKLTVGEVNFVKGGTARILDGRFDVRNAAIDTEGLTFTAASKLQMAAGDTMTLVDAEDAVANKNGSTLQPFTAKQLTDTYSFTPAEGVTVAATLRSTLNATPKNNGLVYKVNSNQADKLTFGSVAWKDSGSLFKRPAAVTFAGAAVDTSEIHFKNLKELKGNAQMTLVSDFGGSPGRITGTTYKIGTTLEGEGAASMANGDLIFTTKAQEKKRVQDQTHNTVMGMTAGLAALAGGTEQISQGMETLSGGDGSGGQEEAESGGMIIASIGGNKMRQETGSHVTSNTWNGVLGIGGKRAVKSGTWQYAAFAEHGRANFTLHSDAGRGDGTSKYTGGGLLAKWQSRHDVYVEGSIRAGRMHDTASDMLYDAATGQSYGYDVHANYIGGHVGLGKVFRYNNGRSLDVYGKYFHMKRDGVSFEAEGHYDLDSVTSSVLRVGARYGATDKKWNWYGGLAYEYEFDGKATGRADGAEIRAASIKGGSVRGELGIRMEATKTSPWKADIRLTGYAGKRRGIGGNVSVAYTF